MNRALNTFSIETDTVIKLSFGDGTVQRAHPDDLANLLQAEDLKKVQKALQLRKNYIKHVLPPWLMLGMLLALGGVGTFQQVKSAIVEQKTSPAATVPTPVADEPARDSIRRVLPSVSSQAELFDAPVVPPAASQSTPAPLAPAATTPAIAEPEAPEPTADKIKSNKPSPIAVSPKLTAPLALERKHGSKPKKAANKSKAKTSR